MSSFSLAFQAQHVLIAIYNSNKKIEKIYKYLPVIKQERRREGGFFELDIIATTHQSELIQREKKKEKISIKIAKKDTQSPTVNNSREFRNLFVIFAFIRYFMFVSNTRK